MSFIRLTILTCILQLAVSKEYCQLEGFNASCPADHVIFITRAKYGRMKLGRCLTRDYYVGCSDDVTSILHERCSGKTKCYVSIPDPALYEKQHCLKDLVSYLDAEYSCLQVTHFANSSCSNNRREILIKEDGGFIAGYQPFPSTVTSPNDKCSLLLRAPRGQKVNITLYEFFNAADSAPNDQQGQYQCIVLATIREYLGRSFRENVVCGGGGHRQELVYASKTNEVVVEVNQPPDGRDDRRRFLLQYQAVGCRDPDIPDDMTQQRRGDQLDVRCNNTGQVWHLVCRGNSWVGTFGNCTTDAGGVYSEGGGSKRNIGFPNAGIVMAIVVGIVLGIMIGFCLLLVVYNVRRKRKKASSSHASALERSGAPPAAKYPEGTYSVNDPMLPAQVTHPDLTADKGCHVMCDVTGTLLRGREREHVYEKPQSGVEVQCLLSPVKPANGPVLTLDGVEAGDYGCHLHRKPTTWSQRAEKFEMMPPPPTCIIQT